ncbi:putative nitrate/nitrite response transcriptional regulatory protein NarL [Lentzea sp. NBRC 105346]|uniref:response regulator transcription factor n=1 Tax=Lentzea sp. NBRC 105346 TaxID=3032205 RepID=UPI0024A346F3|nr:response regulator transcription factor [Lentzea sp. NBRC 105346]GLZ30137.1 putative nitrate/nitrite response transcriptional regulatory protein NarL [Lentzea sp. NBRC 105346]
MAIRLVIVDGQPLARFGLAQLLQAESDIDIVGEADTAAGAVELIARTRPDVVSVDVTLPDGNGLTLARELRDRWQELGIVVLTSNGEDDVLFRAMETGVSAFVPKTSALTEIVGSIRHAAVAASSFTATGLADAFTRMRDARARSPLSPREAEVLRLLQDGLSVPAVARTLHMSTSTAKTYVARLYEKLGASSRAQALMNALDRGLIGLRSA